MVYIKRNMEKIIKEVSKVYPVLMVSGQRQVGKSTMLNHIRENNRTYVTFDNPKAKALAQSDPDLFFETYPYPILIDEFQKVPSLLEKIKEIVDKLALDGKDNNGLFWLTGSQKFKMMKNVSESLAGRIALFELSSLSFDEINGEDNGQFNPNIEELKKKKIFPLSEKEVFRNIFLGGMPKLLTSEIERERYYEDYINTYLERDVLGEEGVSKLNEFYNFLVYMASRTGQELHYDDVAKTIGISAPTVKSRINILEKSGVIFLLKPFYQDINKRLIKSPKIYFMDTGLASYLCRWLTPETLEFGNMNGAFFETYVISEIVKSYLNNGKTTNNLFYYRDFDKREIDLLIVQDNSIYPIEIKKNISPNHPDKNFDVLSRFSELSIKTGLIICLSNELIPYSKKAWYCPISLI